MAPSAGDLQVAPPPPKDTWRRIVLIRRLTYLMLLRVILFTLLLGGTVILHIVWGRPQELGNPFVTILFVFIATIYGLNIIYAILLRLLRRLRILAIVQIAIDLITSAFLVHLTGSAESAFVFLFLLSPIAAAVVLSRRAAIITAFASVTVFVTTVLLAYHRWLPLLPGQTALPWEVNTNALGRSLLITTGATFAIAALGGYLADMLQSAASEVEEQHAILADLTALHEDVVRCLTSGLLTIDSHGRVLTINDAAREILKINDDENIGQPLEILAPALGKLALDIHQIRREEIAIKEGETLRYLGVNISPLVDRSGDEIGRIINFQDLTTLRLMEQMVKRSEQLAALGRVAAGVAHELRNPLASISGSLELMQTMEPTLAPDTRKLMEIALREIDRLDGLVTELLDYSRPKPALPLVPIDLAQEMDTLIAAITKLCAEAEGTPTLRLVKAIPHAHINAHVDTLKGVLWNLVRNAGEAQSQVVNLSISRLQDTIILKIEDDGSGISTEDLEHIFEPFYTTKSHGSGLGLATVHRTIQQHHGTIDVESTPGEGTTFTISFPRVATPPNADT